jgi:hypothetical protein
VAATHLFDIDNVHRHRVLVLEAGPLALPEHVQNLPPDLNPPGKGGPGSVRGQPWLSDSPMSFNQNFPGLAFCIGGRSVFWGGCRPISSIPNSRIHHGRPASERTMLSAFAFASARSSSSQRRPRAITVGCGFAIRLMTTHLEAEFAFLEILDIERHQLSSASGNLAWERSRQVDSLREPVAGSGTIRLPPR